MSTTSLNLNQTKNICAYTWNHWSPGLEFFDHVIVGGGILGASIAYHLSEYSSKRILVIDRGQFASGSSSKAAGLILQCSSKHSNIPLAKKTVDIIPVLEKINCLLYTSDAADE